MPDTLTASAAPSGTNPIPIQGMGQIYNIPDALRPQSHADALVRYDTRGAAMLTVLTNRSKKQKRITSLIHNYGEKRRHTRKGSIVGVYTNATLSTAYTGSGAASSSIYVTMTEVDSRNFLPDDQVVFLQDGEPLSIVRGSVARRGSYNGTYFVEVILAEADSSSYIVASDSTASPAVVSELWQAGSTSASGTAKRDGLMLQPRTFITQCQLWKNSVELAADFRLEEQYYGIKADKEAMMDTNFMHHEDMEKSLMFSLYGNGTGSDGKTHPRCRGIFEFVGTYAPENILDFRSATGANYVGRHWEDDNGRVGIRWMNEAVERTTRFPSGERLALAGAGAITSMAWLAQLSGDFQFNGKTTVYGLNVTEWRTPHGTMGLIEYPHFTDNGAFYNTILSLVPKNIIWCPFRNTKWRMIQEPNTSAEDTHDMSTDLVDAFVAEILTQGCWELHIPESWVIMHGLGQQNTAAA